MAFFVGATEGEVEGGGVRGGLGEEFLDEGEAFGEGFGPSEFASLGGNEGGRLRGGEIEGWRGFILGARRGLEVRAEVADRAGGFLGRSLVVEIDQKLQDRLFQVFIAAGESVGDGEGRLEG